MHVQAQCRPSDVVVLVADGVLRGKAQQCGGYRIAGGAGIERIGRLRVVERDAVLSGQRVALLSDVHAAELDVVVALDPAHAFAEHPLPVRLGPRRVDPCTAIGCLKADAGGTELIEPNPAVGDQRVHAGREIGLRVEGLAHPPELGVQHDIGAEQMHPSARNVAGAVAEDAAVLDGRRQRLGVVQLAIAEPQAVSVAETVVDLDLDRVVVALLRPRVDHVKGRVRDVGTVEVVFEVVPRHRVDTGAGHHVLRERIAQERAGIVRIYARRARIEDDLIEGRVLKVARKLVAGRMEVRLLLRPAILPAFPSKVEKRLVADDRTADGCAVLVLAERRRPVLGGIEERIARVEGIVAQEFPKRPVKLVGA